MPAKPASKIVIPSKFGWQPDVPDYRDHMYVVKAPVVQAQLPVSCDLRPQCPPVLDQGDLGSCTANAIANAHRFEQMKQKEKDFAVSRLFVYYNERKIEGSVNSDSGAQIRDGFKTIAADGVCPETLWPYDIAKFAQQPSSAAYVEALNHQAVKYQRLDDPSVGPLDQAIKHSIAVDGVPAVFGFSVFSNMQSQYVARTGDLGMPGKRDRSLGGHAVLLVGYDAKGAWVMNSWGTGWGLKGFFHMPWAYVLNQNLACDFWQITLTE